MEKIKSLEEWLLKKLGSSHGLIFSFVLITVFSFLSNFIPFKDHISATVSLFVVLLTLPLQFVAFHANRTVALIDNVEKLNKNLLQNPSVSLSTLGACTADFMKRLGDQSDRNLNIEIDHLGLDMDRAWDLYKDLLNANLPKATRAKVRILMITGDKDKIHPLPDKVKIMCDRSSGSMTTIKNDITSIADTLSSQGRTVPLELEIRRYANLPFVHGISVKYPVEVRYISMCSWRQNQRIHGDSYDWGGNTYYIIACRIHPGNTLISDHIDMFEGTFTHLWENNPSESWKFPPTP